MINARTPRSSRIFLASAMHLCRNDCPIARADFCNEMAAIGGTNNRPAQRHDSVHSLPIENDVIAGRQQAFKAIAKTNHFPAELIRRQHYGAQNRIKPRTVATAGQNTNARFHFRRSEIRGIFLDQPSAPQLPIDRIFASRVASTPRLLRTGYCCPGAPPLGDGDKRVSIWPLRTTSDSRFAYRIKQSPARDERPVFTPSMPFLPRSSFVLRST